MSDAATDGAQKLCDLLMAQPRRWAVAEHFGDVFEGSEEDAGILAVTIELHSEDEARRVAQLLIDMDQFGERHDG